MPEKRELERELERQTDRERERERITGGNESFRSSQGEETVIRKLGVWDSFVS